MTTLRAVDAAPAACRGRFAPSPTGPLHFGSLVAALASYCDARQQAGQWIVRVEDVDQPRSRAGAASAILLTLARYGFRWDGEVVVQSRRTSLYEAALERLRERGLAYPCVCTRRDLEQLPPGPVGERVYPGTCRAGIAAIDERQSAVAWRVRADALGPDPVTFVDAVQGRHSQQLARDVGDFVVRRADGLFAYQLAVVVDDAAQGITHVVRGADLLVSTPRQILLQRLLGLPVPAYLHVPVAVDAEGNKLSKQTRATALSADPLSALLAAWRFLDQEAPPAAPGDVGHFWSWAIAHWSRSRVPPVPMLPAPPAYGAVAGSTV